MNNGVKESKWNDFMNSGRIADYLEYKGITADKGEQRIADADCERSCNIGEDRRRTG